MNRIVWVDNGNDDNPAQLKPLGASPAFDIRDPRLTNAYLGARYKTYGAVTVYADTHWPDVPQTPTTFAQWLSASLLPFKPNAPDYPRVCVDMETDDIDGYVLPFLRRWRQLRPRRVTDWTLEGHKGGIFNRGQVGMILDAHVGICPQLYNGAMNQVWDSLAMTRDLIGAGFPEPIIAPVYDAGHLPEWWGVYGTAYAFTQGLLP